MTTRRLKLEQEWDRAYFENERRGTAHTARAEESARDRLYELCEELGECQHTGCRRQTGAWAYCEEHRVN